MTQGERIRYIRTERGLTQQQLGEMCGFSESTADVRIRQYESNKKSPKDDTLRVIAKALKVNYAAIKNYDSGCAEDVLETLFWLDQQNFIDLFPLDCVIDYHNNWKYKGSYNDEEYLTIGDPFGIVIKYGLVNMFMAEWYQRKMQLKNNEITEKQYNNWKWNWPESCDDSKDRDYYVDWMNLS